jgi:hypothetical protein
VFVCRFQGVVRGEIAVEGVLKGVTIPMNSVEQITQDSTR